MVAPTDEPLDPRRWFAASVAIVSVAIPVLDNTVLNLAVPTILREFHTQLSSLQWVITGYSLTFATLLIIGGRLGDIFGHRRMFVLGAVDLRRRIVPRVDLHVGADAVRRRGADRRHRRVDDDPGDAVDPLDHVQGRGAAEGVRGMGRGRRRVGGVRPDRRRLPDDRLLVALGVPHQRDRRADHRDRRAAVHASRRARRPAAAHRRAGRGADRRRARSA